MNPREVDREEFVEEWTEFFQEAVEEAAVEKVEDMYREILRENLDSTMYLSNLPEEARGAMVEMAAGIYGEQAERILDSSYVGHEELGMAAATAFLDEKRQVKVGAQAQGLVELYWSQMTDKEQRYGKEKYQEWAFQALTQPWPPEQLNEWEHGERFKPPEEDPTYQ